MPTIALLSGAAALIAGLLKFGMDAYRAKSSPPSVNVSIGNESIQVPSSYTPDQIATLVSALRDRVSAGHPAK